MTTKDRYNELKKRAARLGYEINWSPVNQAYFIMIAPPGAIRKLVGVKNDLDGVSNFLDDEEGHVSITSTWDGLGPEAD